MIELPDPDEFCSASNVDNAPWAYSYLMMKAYGEACARAALEAAAAECESPIEAIEVRSVRAILNERAAAIRALKVKL